MRTETVAISGLHEWPGNPRRHDLETIKDSLMLHGQFRPIVVQASSMRIVAGHGTTQAARQLGWTELQAVILDVDDDEAARILLVDNRANDGGGYEPESLAAMLGRLSARSGGLMGTGYDDESYRTLLRQLEEDATYGNVVHGRTPGERRDDYVENGRSNLVLPYDAADHEQVLGALGQLRRKFDMDSNADVVRMLVEARADHHS